MARLSSRTTATSTRTEQLDVLDEPPDHRCVEKIREGGRRNPERIGDGGKHKNLRTGEGKKKGSPRFFA